MTPPINSQLVKALVKANRWQELGRIFGFVPIYHFEGKNFLDWRCVPQTMLDLLRDKKGQVSRSVFYPQTKKRIIRLYESQNGICHYCKRRAEFTSWSIDHRLPKFRGGSNSESNLIGSCKFCNGNKSCLNEEEFLALMPGTKGISARASLAVRKLMSELEKSAR